MTQTPTRPLRGPAVREAIVDAAGALFAEHGIRAVSADRIIAAAGCSKVTFYRHFPSKDDAVVAYLERDVARVRGLLARAAEDPGQVTLAVFTDALIEEMCRPHFRGCPFINAAAEYPDPDHPVRRVVAEFRDLMTGAIAAWLAPHGVRDAGSAAEQVMMLRDGALVGGYLSGDPDRVAREFAAAVEAILGS